jgi:methyl-accepting chemotaxis protein
MSARPAFARGFRFPMFLKFLLGCLLLAGFLIFGATLLVKSKSTLRSRGNFLAKHLQRYEFYQERTGRTLTGTLEILVSDANLKAALAVQPREAEVPAPGAPGSAPTAPPPTPPAVPPPQRAQIAEVGEAMHKRLMSENGIQPHVFAIFGPTGKLLWAPPKSPIEPDVLPNLAAIQRARANSPFMHRIQVIDKTPYQMTALPILQPGTEQVIGGLVIGMRLQDMMIEYATQTDRDTPTGQFRPVLLDGSTLLASSLPGNPTEVARAMQPDKLKKITVGEDTREVIRLKDHDYDFYFEDMDGYKNADAMTIGKIYIARSRANVVDPGKALPWAEILVGIAASVAIALLLGYWVTRPIKQMVVQSRGLLAGDTDLTQRIVVNSRDETADLAENINQVFARVHNLATGVQSAAFQVGASSAEISAASREMLSGLKDQTLKIESSTTAVTELSASIQQVAGNAAQATDVAEKSSTAVNSAVERMEQIREAVDDAASKMKDLGESSKRIGNIVEVIRQISEQTSMLALNASIEAAHAGEQGRGFAVVADEVSSLARRVGQSAKDIEALIQTVKEQTQAAIASMEIGTREVVGGSQLVTSTLNGLGELITVVKDTATAVHEQAVVSDEIARNMDAVRHIAGEVLHGSEESVIQAERLHELAFELEESIAGFNLEGKKVTRSRPRNPNGDPRSQRTLPAGGRPRPAVSPEEVSEKDG